MQQQAQLKWKDRRDQKRKKNIFRSAAFIIILAAILTIILILVGIFSPIVGGALFAGAALFIAFLAWQYPRSAPSQDVSSLQPVILAQTSTVSSVLPITSVAISLSNPFNPLGKLRSPNDFYGRINERTTLIERTQSNASTSIVGPRRIGKTWLIQYLMLVAPTELGSAYLIVEMSTQSAADFRTLEEFVTTFLQELKSQVLPGTEANKVLENALISLKKEQAKSHPNILAVLERAVQDLSQQAIVLVLCIDEFDSIANSPQRKQQFNLDFFRSLRTMADSQNTNLVLVIASQNPLKKIVGRVGHESGFFNIFDQLRIHPFSLEEAIDFVQTKGDQAQFTDAERDLLIAAGGQGWWLWRKYRPFRLEQAGNLLYLDKIAGNSSYLPEDRRYQRRLKRILAEKSVI